MASDNEASCESDPNFAVICAFMEKFGGTCGLAAVDFLELQEMLENTQEVPQELIDLHIKLLRKSRKTVSNERWEKAIIKICHGFCVQDAWEIERFGYKKARLSSKLRVLKELLEMQFDYNARFKAEINKMSAEELRSQPLGKDKHGHAYWFQNDNSCQIRVYKEDPDEETWTLVAKDREGLVSLINELSNGDSKISSESGLNEDDSNSLVEKPIIDTGQVDSSSSDSTKKILGESESSNESKKEDSDVSDSKKENISPAEDDEEEEEEERSPPQLKPEGDVLSTDETSKRSREGSDDNEERETKKTKIEEEESQVSEAVEEPIMLVKGEGAGEDNECVNPIIGEEIEEDAMYFYGCGSGFDCQTGNNEDKDAKKPEASADGESESGETVSSEKSTHSKDGGGSENCVSISVKSDSKNCIGVDDVDGSSKEVPTSPVKSPFRLGTIIDTKTDNKFFNTISRSPTKKSRWDVETIIAKDTPEPANCLVPNQTEPVGTGRVKELVDKWEQINDEEKQTENDVTTPKKSMFFFGPGCLQFSPVSCSATVAFGQKVPQENVETSKVEVEEVTQKSDVGYRIGDDKDNKEVESVETIECVQSSKGAGQSPDVGEEKTEETSRVDQETPIESRIEDKLEDVRTNETVDEDKNEETKVDQQNVDVHEETEVVESATETEKNDGAIEETPTETTENPEDDHDKQQNDCQVETTEDLEAAIEKQIVPEDETCDVELPISEEQKIPEVTAALVECEEAKPESTNVIKQEESKESDDSLKISEEREPVPVIEDECVKKEAYLLGEKTEEEEETKVNSVDAIMKETKSLNEAITQLKVDVEEKDEGKVGKEEEEEKVVNHQPPEVVFVPTIKKAAEEEESALDLKMEIKEDQETNRENGDVKTDKIEETRVNNSENKKTEESEVKETGNNANNKTVKGRRNNISEEQPKMSTRRSTRSSKIEEKPEKTMEVKAKMTEEMSPVKEEKNASAPPKEEKMKTDEPQPRRGRSRAISKPDKDEAAEGGDASKKMKLEVEEIEQKAGRQTRHKAEKKGEEEEGKSPKFVEVESGHSSDVGDNEERDPLAVSEEEAKEAAPMSLATFSLDFNESPAPPVTRSGLRKRGRESPPNSEETEETAGKRMKKARRNIDAKLRKSVEEQKKQELISSDDDKSEQRAEQVEEKNVKKKGKKKVDQVKNEDAASSDPEAEAQKEPAQKKNKNVNKNKRLLSNLGINPEQALDFGEDIIVGVRQSRRIAQLKIKEEAERRKLEEEMTLDPQKKKKSKKSDDKDYRVDKKKLKNDDDDDDAIEEDSTDSKKKKKKKKKKHRKLFDEFNPWRSSSDSSSSDEEEDDEICEESDDEVLQYVSDHEFSPESDMEGDGEALPLKRARTARKESDVEEVDDCPCQKCSKSDHPEWILLCDKCDNGWHCSCLRPPLLVIPEGDWFCPPCQHVTLLKKLQEKLKEYDKKLRKKELEDRRKQRLAYVGISLNSVLPAKETEVIKKRRRSSKENEDEDEMEDEEEDESSSGEESESGSGSGSESGSDSDEPIYQLRQRRQAHSYRFNDYDELINSAIQEEMEAVKGAGNQGRGKDIATIVNAEKEEERKKETEVPGDEQPEVPEPLPPVVPPDDRDKEAKPLYSDDEPVQGVRKKMAGRKKHRKLNSLDISSADDDEDSDEDFKGTSSESDDDFEDDLGSEDSEDLDSGRGRRRGLDPVRRSTRARTSRYDADFIDDGDSEDEEEAPRRKKKRSIWDETESEESDRSWGRRKRKPVSKQKKTSTSNKKKKSKKKKKDNDDSDAEVYRKKKPKIKFGLDGDDEGPGRRTRGKKINYVDALGSDSDEDRVKRPPPRIESEEEYVANEDEDFDEDDKVTDEEEGDSGEENNAPKPPKVQIQSYADARFTQLLPEGVPTPKDLYLKSQVLEDGEDEPNPIDQINRNVEMMDENEMEKMMEEEEYANKQLQMVALQLEKEKRRKEREAKKLEGLLPPQVPQQDQNSPKKRGRKPKNQFQFSGPMQEPIVGNVDSLIVNSENNDELSEPPGVSLPLFAELGSGGEGMEDPAKKRRGRVKKSLEEAVANLGSVRQQESAFMPMVPKNPPTELGGQESNIEIAAPPQPFSQSQPTPSVITRMLQSKPGQPGYPIGTIRPKQFAAMSEREEEAPTSHHSMSPAPAHHGQYLQGAGLRPQLSSPYRQMPPSMNHYPRGAPPLRNPVPQTIPSHIYHSHRPMDPSPSGGGTINMAEHNSPGRVVSPASSSPGSNKNETPPSPYTRPPVGRFPMINTTNAGPRHMHMVATHLQPPRPNLSPYHPSMPPSYHYGQFGQMGATDDAMPPTVYQNSPYSEQFPEGQVNQSENSNSKSFDEESGGEFGGLVSYFSSQREDDLES